MSVVLVDTHIALWALGEPARLTNPERSLLIDPTIDRCLSPISIGCRSFGGLRRRGDGAEGVA